MRFSLAQMTSNRTRLLRFLSQVAGDRMAQHAIFLSVTAYRVLANEPNLNQ